MFGILAKFFRFSGRENGNKFKLSIVIGLIEALASAMKIPAIMYILIGLLSGKPTGKYIGGSVVIMVLAIVVDVICKRYSTVLQTEGGYNASAFMRIKIAEHLRYLPMGYFNSNSIGEISSITTNTMEIPVSYTHLDVYKRQFIRCFIRRIYFAVSHNTSSSAPISNNVPWIFSILIISSSVIG